MPLMKENKVNAFYARRLMNHVLGMFLFMFNFRLFANGPGDLGSILGRVIPKPKNGT